MKKNVFIGVGVAKSGKSKFFKMLMPNAKIISAVEIRKQMFGNENYSTNNNEVFDELFTQIRHHLKNSDQDLIINNTSITTGSRKSITNIVDLYPEWNITFVYFKPNNENIKAQIEKSSEPNLHFVFEQQTRRIQPISRTERQNYNVIELML